MTIPQFPQFWISELIQFNHNALLICKSNGVPELPFADKMYNLQQATAALDNAYRKEQSNYLFDDMLQADTRRNTALAGISLTANAFAYHFDFTLALASEKVLQCVNRHGGIYLQLNGQAETLIIKRITDEWTKDLDFAQAVATLQLTSWFNELKQANDQFNLLSLLKSKEQSDSPKIPTIELRHVAIESFRTLIGTIEAYHTITNNGSFLSIINQFDELIVKYNALVFSRITRGKSKIEMVPVN